MSEELLRFYNSELHYLRRLGDQFARANPQIAANLRLGTDGDYDPYVGRLVEAFAFLNARTRLKLEDGFPEIAGTYLDIIYPHFQRPMPSAMIAQFKLDLGQSELFEGYRLPRDTPLGTPRTEGFSCEFRTVYETHCWPFKVASCSFIGLPYRAPRIPLPQVSQGLLKLRLETLAEHVRFSSFDCKSLRFYLRLPPPYSYQLYESLFNDILGIAVALEPEDPNPQLIPVTNIKPVGFGEHEGMVDYPPQSFLGYRLLSEYFSFPEKFCFFDLNLPPGILPPSRHLEIFFFFRKRWEDLETAVSDDSLRLGCTPVVNLFPKRLEPLQVTHYRSEYPLTVDSRRGDAFEIYSIDQVIGHDDDREEVFFQPFYSMNHQDSESRYFWFASRSESEATGDLSHGTEMNLSLVDLQFNPLAPAAGKTVVYVEATCTNRNLPSRLPVVPDQTELEMESAGAIDACVCLSKPSDSLRPPLGPERRWRLVSQLSLNHISFTNKEHGAAALRELLGLYALRDTDWIRSQIDGLLQVESKPTVGRLPGDATGAICRGTEIRLSFDESKYTAGNLFLFASVLENFVALLSNINSFTRTVAVSNKRTGDFHRWPARCGQQPVL